MNHLKTLKIDAYSRLRNELMSQAREIGKLLLNDKLNVSEAIYLLNEINDNLKKIDDFFIENDYSDSLSDSTL